MKTGVHVRSSVVAIVLIAGLLALPCWTHGFGSERSVQTKTNQQILVDRFDKILHLARIQHAQIEEWNKRPRAQVRQNKTVQKTKNVVAMQ
ncbi:MAG: hypothetical protein HY912_10575 [Desulfomonile tiedjei]|uniref:Uncharacterized protein n=1 Tax=Desulfomonile tiedjei TaxID=2358 RepID=A0A9D6V4N6_9BACT|nr:hypothetical protein [Desulfomonile tiedjei]